MHLKEFKVIAQHNFMRAAVEGVYPRKVEIVGVANEDIFRGIELSQNSPRIAQPYHSTHPEFS